MELDKSSGSYIIFFKKKHSELDFYFKHVNGGITCFETKTNGELFMNFFNFTEHLKDLPSKL